MSSLPAFNIIGVVFHGNDYISTVVDDILEDILDM